MNARKKKAVELLAARRPAPQPMSDNDADDRPPVSAPASPPMSSRFADVIAKRRAAGKK